MKDRNKRKLIIYVLVGVLMLTTVAYAALSTVLNVSGTVVKKGNLWNIYFTNPSSASIVGTATGSSINIQASSLNFQVSLYKPGDKVTYTVDIKNGGTIDAVLNSISLTGLDTAKSNSLNYTVTYSNGSTIKEGDTLNVGASRTIKITVEFDSNATSLPENDVNLTFGVTLIYGQTTSSSSTGTSGITSNNVIAGIYGESIQNGTPTPTSPVEIKSVGEKTKNLIPYPYTYTKTWTEKGVTFADNGDGSITVSGTATDYAAFIITQYLLVDSSKTYTLSFNATNVNNLAFQLTEYDKDKKLLNNIGISNLSDVYIYKPSTSAVKYISFYIKRNNNAACSGTIRPQLEVGSTATSYEPYGYKVPITVSNGTETKTTNIYLKGPLRKVGEYADYLDLTNKKVVRNVKELVFNGTENIEKWTSQNVSYGFLYRLKSDDSLKKQIPISNYFKKGISSVPVSKDNSVGLNPPLFFGTVDWETVSDFKSWLTEKYNSGDPVLVDYILATPTEESIDVPEIPSLTGNITYSVGTSITSSKIEYGY